MAGSIQKVGGYSTLIPDRPGEALRMLLGLKEAGVNLLACSASPAGSDQTRWTLFPEYREAFRSAASRLGITLGGEERAFLVQEGDRVGAVADTFAKLASRSIHVVAAHAVSADAGHYAMIVEVAPADFDRAAEVLGF